MGSKGLVLDEVGFNLEIEDLFYLILLGVVISAQIKQAKLCSHGELAR